MPKVYVEFVRADKAWSSGKVEIDANGDVLELSLLEGKSNSFNIRCYDDKGDALPCFPDEITIIQGSVVGAAPLPYNIGIATWSEIKKRGVFRMAKGLEKNKPLPAVGVVNDLKTTNQLRPGVSSDTLVVPIYQVDDFSEAEGKSAALYEHVADVAVTGDDVDTLITEGSLVDLTLKVDSSEQMKLEVHFLSTDTTVEKILDTHINHLTADTIKEIKRGLSEAKSSIGNLSESGIGTNDLQEELTALKKDYENSTEPKEVLSNLRKLLRKIENLEEGTEWQRLESELREEFDRLEKAQSELGNDKTAQLVGQLRKQTDDAIRAKNVQVGREVLQQVHSLFFRMTILYQCMAMIKHYNDRFGTVRWKDSSRARQLINRGMEQMNDNPTTEGLRQIVLELFKLMPEDEAANAGGLLR